MSLFGAPREKGASKRIPQENHKWEFASFSDQREGKKVKSGRKVYGIWGAMKYTMVLSLLLWWLPVFGQMIAGYIGGRKAGSPLKGVIAAVLPVVAIFAVMTLIDHFLSGSFYGTGSASASLLAGFTTGLPIIGPYLEFTRDYVSKFIDSLAGASPYGMNSYVITLAFAYIGGILADQTRREIEAVSGAAGSHTTVVVAPNEHGFGAMGQSTMHNPIPAVGSFISGKMSALSPSRRMRAARASHFDGMVAIRDIDGAEEEPEEVSGTKRSGHRRVRKVRKLKVSPAKAAKPAPVERPRPKIVVSPARPATFRTAQRKIEREWDPARRMRAAGSPPMMAHKRQVIQDGGAQMPARPSIAARRPPTRSWDTI